MLFNSLEFLAFFTLVYILYWALQLSKKIVFQNTLLLIASYIFYGAWSYKFLGLILFSSVVDYFCARAIVSKSEKKRPYLIVSLLVNLGVLAFFKYYNFFTGEFNSLLGAMGLDVSIPILNLVLPVGISFYTFQSMSYTIDIYKGKVDLEKNILTFLLYVSFFPQLVAGPIERARNLLPQLNKRRVFDWNAQFDGLWLIYLGYFLKVFMADNLAFVVEESFRDSGTDFFVVLSGSYAFAMQIFGDFAGYTFIAIGVAKLLGFDLMTNFLYPYFVKNPSDFWRNWHISLSTWLRDYLYIPLGGNRGSKLFTYRNLMITMLLGGLWHGAAWTFVIWGLFHGLLLIIYRVYAKFFDRIPGFLAMLLMFHLVCFGWLIFRAENFNQLFAMLSSCGDFTFSTEAATNMKKILFYALIPMLINYFQFKQNSGNYIHSFYRPIRIALYVLMYFLIFGFGEFGVKEFIYFQF